MILVDADAWLALADKGDAYHARCVAFFRSNREPLMTPTLFWWSASI